ncbi:MAG: phenylalanine--tRNA ligase subunit alpha [Peptococcaceae bacterium]|nr:phenylalanine--tRNA ligase subunit alpha [Peptococcaceae bacterium]
MEQKLLRIQARALEEMAGAKSLEELNEIRVRYLGKKGELTGVLRGMGALSPEERPRIGQIANQVRDKIEEKLNDSTARLKDRIKREKLAAESLDITLPGTVFNLGRLHPLTVVTRRIEDIFLGLGFSIAEGPEVELDYYNFEALNLPKDHPARDMQDTFFITQEVLLRTHTSPVQVRTMERTAPALPVKIIAPGKVYRRDDDATHSPMFHQVEGLAVDRRITMADLRGVLQVFAEQMFGPETRTRFRPSYFPFTEPSAEVDISCVMCGGRGCRTCSHTGWLEILGCGMVHPRVLEMSGYNSGEVTGFAFGMGVERITMLKYGIDDLRLLFENDMRFLQQF